MKKLIFIFGLVSYPLFTFSQSDTVVIKGKVHSGNIENVKIEWLKDNPVSDISKTFSAPVNNKSEFVLKIPLSRIATGQIAAGNFYHNICLLPSDSFYVDIDADTIKYTGQGANKNSFLYFLETKGLSDASFYNETNECKLSPKNFAPIMADFRDRRIELLKSYSNKYLIESEFTNYFLAENQAIYINLIITYPQRYSYFNKIKEDSLELTSEYFRYNQLANIVNDNFTVSWTYIYLLREFLFKKSDEMRKRDDIKKLSHFAPFHIIMIDSLKGKTQEYVMAKWLCTDLSRDNLDTVIYDNFKKIAKDSMAINSVKMAFDKYNQKRALINQPLNDEFIQTALEDTIGNKLSFGELMEMYKGKVVYLDIWGLACGPCRTAMPASKKLKEKLTGKPIEFVYLTVEWMNKKRWDEAFKVSLTNQNHYHLTDGFDSKLLKFMEINWVPCYMIFDKEGYLISYNAKGPWNEYGLEKQLTELSEKK